MIIKSKLSTTFLSKATINKTLKLTGIYGILICLAFVFLYPMLYMAVNSFLSPNDLVDPAISWIPSELYFGNFVQAFETLDFTKSFINSIMMSAVPALLQTISTALVGFGLARCEIPLKGMWLILIISTFLIPVQITTLPQYILYDTYHILDTVLPSFLSAALGQGLRSAIFILVFYQFFSTYPKAFDEAAELDGASKVKIFYKIALPNARPAIVLALLFSFVWYWNETSQANMFFGNAIKTLPLQLQDFTARYNALFGGSGGVVDGSAVNTINESISLAGTLLSVLPILILYITLQRQFVESVENSGITGE